MPLYRVRRDRCIPYEIVVEAPDMEAAEIAADSKMDLWSEGPAYWQDLETYILEDGEEDPALTAEDFGEE